jgi:hypothetical protein
MLSSCQILDRLQKNSGLSAPEIGTLSANRLTTPFHKPMVKVKIVQTIKL